MKKKKQPKKFNKVLQFKITLNDSTPKIWRRIVVPKNYSFFDLHCAIQDAMGWSDGHLHGYYVKQEGTSRPLLIELPNPEGDLWGMDEALDERKEKISDYFGKQIKQCRYMYDFGDSWDHIILLERELDKDPKLEYPLCKTGENACPPEDCGGVWGYDNLQKILKNPKDSSYKDRCEWMGIEKGEEFDPYEFDVSEVYFEDPEIMLKEWEEWFGME